MDFLSASIFEIPNDLSESFSIGAEYIGERLDVVDQRRPAVEALDRRERRLQARVAALALERVEQRRLLAADVGAGAAVDDQLEVAVGAEDVGPEVTRLVGFGDGGVEDVGLGVVLAADEDEGVPGVGGEGGDRDPLDQLVGVALHQLAVLEGAGLGLVGVAAEVLGHVAARQEGRLFCPSRSQRRRGPAGPTLRAP